MREPHCDIRSEKGRPINGWQRGGLSDGGWVIGKAKKEGKKLLRVVCYMFYGKSFV